MAITQPTVTGWSSFWSLTGDGVPYTPISVSQKGYRSPLERGIARITRRNQLRSLTAVATALIGAAAGGTATASYSRVKAPLLPSAATPQPTFIGEIAGNRTIETQTDMSRVTTSADVTYIKGLFNTALLEANITYPTVQGSGGGGMLVNGAPSFGG